MKPMTIAVAAAALALIVCQAAFAAEPAKTPGKSDTLKWAEAHFKYVGETKCKTCHNQQYTSWMETKHAKAWSVLKPEEQKKECAECHITGKTSADSLLVNVGCESCHGPGSEYRSMTKMRDAKLAAAAGLMPVTEATCVRCHNARSPQFKAPFDFAKAKELGVHKHFTKAK